MIAYMKAFQKTIKGTNFIEHYMWKVKKVTRQEKVQIITVSNESKKEIVKYYNVAPNRITVIGNCWEQMKEITLDE